MMLRRNCHSLDVKHYFSRLGVFFLHHKVDIPAYHHRRKLFRRRIFDIDGSDIFSFPQHAAPVCRLHDLCQLMGDEQYALALRCQIFHNLHQLFYLLRRQHRRRLVKDKDLIVPVEHLKYLRPLLHAYRNIFNQCIRIHEQPILFRKRNHFLPRLILLEKSALCRLHAQDNVIEDAETFHQLKMLMDHPDSQIIRIIRIVDLHFLSVLVNLALLRLVQPEKHAHKR